MTLIVHRCTHCHHPDVHHTGPHECSWGHCRTGPHDFAPGTSEVLMTYGPTGDVITTVACPGEPYGDFGRFSFRPCACDDCWDLYRAIRGGGVS